LEFFAVTADPVLWEVREVAAVGVCDPEIAKVADHHLVLVSV
jgi:hypothetical protein